MTVPEPVPPTPAVSSDAQQLDLLVVFHYVLAAFAALFSMFPLIHLFIGIGLLAGAINGAGNEGLFIGGFFILFAGIWITLGLTFATCVAIAARKLSRRTGHTYCLIIGSLECLFMPFGTILGVFTIVVLMRDSVKAMFR